MLLRCMFDEPPTIGMHTTSRTSRSLSWPAAQPYTRHLRHGEPPQRVAELRDVLGRAAMGVAGAGGAGARGRAG